MTLTSTHPSLSHLHLNEHYLDLVPINLPKALRLVYLAAELLCQKWRVALDADGEFVGLNFDF